MLVVLTRPAWPSATTELVSCCGQKKSSIASNLITPLKGPGKFQAFERREFQTCLAIGPLDGAKIVIGSEVEAM